MLDTTLASARHDAVLETKVSGSVVRDMPNGESKFNTDRRLMELVTKALGATGYPALRNLDIEICGGIAVLWGRVPNYHQKQLAQEAAQRVEGVRGIANGVEVVCCR